MNIDNIEETFFKKIKEALEEINDPSLKVTLIKKIANQSIDKVLNRSKKNNSLTAKISSMFSGRGKAWAKTIVSDKNPVWINMRHVLSHEILHNQPSSSIYKECTNLLDTFESSGLAWMRYSSVSNNIVRFNLRTKGSKLENHIKFCIDSSYLFSGEIENLDGIPHKLGLEPGIFEFSCEKEKIDIEVSKEELSVFGIQRIEDLF